MTEQGQPSIGWVRANAKWLSVLAVVGVFFAWLFNTVNPTTVQEFMVTQERKDCEARLHTFIDDGRFCHSNMPPGQRWMCWNRKP